MIEMYGIAALALLAAGALAAILTILAAGTHREHKIARRAPPPSTRTANTASRPTTGTRTANSPHTPGSAQQASHQPYHPAAPARSARHQRPLEGGLGHRRVREGSDLF